MTKLSSKKFPEEISSVALLSPACFIICTFNVDTFILDTLDTQGIMS